MFDDILGKREDLQKNQRIIDRKFKLDDGKQQTQGTSVGGVVGAPPDISGLKGRPLGNIPIPEPEPEEELELDEDIWALEEEDEDDGDEVDDDDCACENDGCDGSGCNGCLNCLNSYHY